MNGTQAPAALGLRTSLERPLDTIQAVSCPDGQPEEKEVMGLTKARDKERTINGSAIIPKVLQRNDVLEDVPSHSRRATGEAR